MDSVSRVRRVSSVSRRAKCFFHKNIRLVSRVRRVSSVSRKALLFFYEYKLGMKRLFRNTGLSEKSEKGVQWDQEGCIFFIK